MNNSLELDRRSLLQHALTLVGATSAAAISLPSFAQAAKVSKKALSPGQSKLLEAVADTIMPRTDTPGAIEAGVPDRFDALLANWASAMHRTDLVSALDGIDLLARTKTGKTFAQLTPEMRLSMLTEHDRAAYEPRSAEPPSVRAAPTSQYDLFAKPGYARLKDLVLLLYYMSEPALTKELPYDPVPGGWKPSIPVTPQTRCPGM